MEIIDNARKVPSSRESEMYIIGSIFIDNNVLPEVKGKLHFKDFYSRDNQNIVQAMYNLDDNGVDIDPVSVSDELNRLGLLEASGGLEYLFELIDGVPSIANVSVYVDIVKEKAVERELYNVAKQIADDVLSGRFQYAELLDNSEKQILEILEKRETTPFTRVDLAAERVFDIIESNKGDDHGLTGLDTGFNQLNDLTFGWQRGELIILAARPGVGKSAFALNMATNACKLSNAHVAFFSLEMSIDQLVMRLFSSLSGVSLTKIRSGKLSKSEMAMLLAAKASLLKMNLYLDESNTTDLGEIRAKCKKLKREGQLDFIIVDYLQLLNVSRSRGNRTEDVGQISRGLKMLARELDVPVMALSQLSRAVENRPDKRPILADLRESGSIEQDADIVMFLSRDMPKDGEERKSYGSQTELIIAKNRQGMTDSIDLVFKGANSSFISIDNKQKDSANKE